ncbi:MAG: hypothetical protein LBS56_10935 [Propionibacteriaceae bacterium]|nr:hypothetical protein [Propionibacteriaceae bacterium]
MTAETIGLRDLQAHTSRIVKSVRTAADKVVGEVRRAVVELNGIRQHEARD